MPAKRKKQEKPSAKDGGDRKRPRKRGNKAKGLRHFSMKVCEKVRKKGTTTYNEVADELVKEFTSEFDEEERQYDQKNIRRRVYDALNVLMAMNIIAKDKKDISWVGLPTNSKKKLEEKKIEKEESLERIEKKQQHLQELIMQQISFKNLIERNTTPRQHEHIITLPFIVINTKRDTTIECQMSEDREEIFFNFSLPFEIHDDNEILRRMEMHMCTPTDLEKMVPAHLIEYVPASCLLSESPQPEPEDQTSSSSSSSTTTTTTTAAAVTPTSFIQEPATPEGAITKRKRSNKSDSQSDELLGTPTRNKNTLRQK